MLPDTRTGIFVLAFTSILCVLASAYQAFYVGSFDNAALFLFPAFAAAVGILILTFSGCQE